MACIRPFGRFAPDIDPSAFVAETATVIGEVRIAAGASIWYGTVLRGDVGAIEIGERSNIQDLCMVHCTTDRSRTLVGREVSVGHGAVLHGCILGDGCLVGMGSIVMDNAEVGRDAVVAAGAVVLEGQVLESGCLYAGMPARRIKALSAEQVAANRRNAAHYIELFGIHRQADGLAARDRTHPGGRSSPFIAKEDTC